MPRDGMYLERAGGTAIYRWNIFRDYSSRFTAALSTRIGGCSSGHLAELNLGHAVEDNPGVLSANRCLIMKALGLPPGLPWSVANQIHGCRISPANTAGFPAEGTDALDVSVPGLVAVVMLADCHPIIIYDPEKHCAIIAHAGIPESNIGRAGFCTACKPKEFYSYRNEKGLTGRHAALVALH